MLKWGCCSARCSRLFYALFSLPMGRLADGWTRTKLLAICLLFWSLATGLAGFASSFALLAFSRLGVGIGEAATQPAGTSLVYDYWPKERRGFVMAMMASAIALGIGGSLILGGVAAEYWTKSYPDAALKGWQFAFLVAAAPGILLAPFLWFLREPERGAMDGIITPADPAPFRASGQVLASVLPGMNWLSLSRFKAAAGDLAQQSVVAGGHCGGDDRVDCPHLAHLPASAAGFRRRSVSAPMRCNGA